MECDVVSCCGVSASCCDKRARRACQSATDKLASNACRLGDVREVSDLYLLPVCALLFALTGLRKL